MYVHTLDTCGRSVQCTHVRSSLMSAIGNVALHDVLTSFEMAIRVILFIVWISCSGNPRSDLLNYGPAHDWQSCTNMIGGSMRYHDCPQRPCLTSSRLRMMWCSALYVRMCVGCELPGVRRPVCGRLMSMASVAPGSSGCGCPCINHH